MIPKILHQVWVGGNPLPERERRWSQSWKKLHPDWNHILWTEKNIQQLEMSQNSLKAISNAEGIYACQADIIRYWAVRRHGGFYVDTDVECFKSIENLRQKEKDIILLRPHTGNWLTNAFFGSTQDHKFLKDLTVQIESPTKQIVQDRRCYLWGPNYLTRQWKKHTQSSHSKCIEDCIDESSMILSYRFWSNKNPDSYCKHYFNASWIKKD